MSITALIHSGAKPALLCILFAQLSFCYQFPLQFMTANFLRSQSLEPRIRANSFPRPAFPACLSLRMAKSGEPKGFWTPDQKPTGLWTPGGEVLIETELTEKQEERPLLEAEWEIMLGQSADLKKLAMSGVLMQEITDAGEDLRGVNVTEVGMRSVGEALNLELVFTEFKALLAQETFIPTMAMPTSRMLSACFRKGKQNWMEGLGALQVMGFDPEMFITKQGVTKVVNLDALCLQLAGMMGMEERVLEEGGYTDAVLLGVKNLAVGVSRVLVRFALLEEVIKRQPKAGGFNLVVTSRAEAFIDKEGILLPEGADQNILRSDFTPSLEWQEIDATVGGQPAKALLVPVKAVDSWLSGELGMQGPKIIT